MRVSKTSNKKQCFYQNLQYTMVKKIVNGKKLVFQRSSKGFIKEKETNGLLSKFGIKTLMSNVPILADIFLNIQSE